MENEWLCERGLTVHETCNIQNWCISCDIYFCSSANSFTDSDPLLIFAPLAVNPAAPVEGAVAGFDARLPEEGVASPAAEQVAGARAGGPADSADPARCASRVCLWVHVAEARRSGEGLGKN